MQLSKDEKNSASQKEPNPHIKASVQLLKSKDNMIEIFHIPNSLSKNIVSKTLQQIQDAHNDYKTDKERQTWEDYDTISRLHQLKGIHKTYHKTKILMSKQPFLTCLQSTALPHLTILIIKQVSLKSFQGLNFLDCQKLEQLEITNTKCTNLKQFHKLKFSSLKKLDIRQKITHQCEYISRTEFSQSFDDMQIGIPRVNDFKSDKFRKTAQDLRFAMKTCSKSSKFVENFIVGIFNIFIQVYHLGKIIGIYEYIERKFSQASLLRIFLRSICRFTRQKDKIMDSMKDLDYRRTVSIRQVNIYDRLLNYSNGVKKK